MKTPLEYVQAATDAEHAVALALADATRYKPRALRAVLTPKFASLLPLEVPILGGQLLDERPKAANPPPHLVPSYQWHRWDGIPKKGRPVTCKRCGCVKTVLPNWQVEYQLPGKPATHERPTCPGKRSISPSTT